MQAVQRTIQAFGDAALLVTCAYDPGEAASARVLALDAAVRAAALPGVIAIVPAYTTLLVHLDLSQTTLARAARAIAQLPAEHALPAARLWQIPAVYDGADLPEVAARLELSVPVLIAAHAGADYEVACIGFAPGFAYLRGLPPELHVPRRPSPRASIPGGSLILGGQQTAIMPMAMPSGWHVLGRTRVALFDAQRAAPSLLLPGDRVRFVPVSAGELAVAEARCEASQ
jgi:KipI family sensor histidine kinase inhibitor